MSLLSPRLAVVIAIMTLGSAAVASPRPQDPGSSAPVCMGLVLPSVTGVEGNAGDVSSAVRALFASYLNGPSIKTQLLDARLPSQAVLEAQAKGCGHVLLVSVTRKHSNGGSKMGGILGQAAEGAAWRVPYSAGVGGAVAAGAAIGAVSSMASDTKKKDEVELAYRVGSPQSVEAAAPVVSKAKAKSDGEDLLTPLVEHASEDIVRVATAK